MKQLRAMPWCREEPVDCAVLFLVCMLAWVLEAARCAGAL